MGLRVQLHEGHLLGCVRDPKLAPAPHTEMKTSISARILHSASFDESIITHATTPAVRRTDVDATHLHTLLRGKSVGSLFLPAQKSNRLPLRVLSVLPQQSLWVPEGGQCGVSGYPPFRKRETASSAVCLSLGFGSSLLIVWSWNNLILKQNICAEGSWEDVCR